jgi:NifB/MoaA-like Fe-S oxidoreductase
VHDLAEHHPGVISVAIVPVGLTDHREGLARIRRLTPSEMRETIALCETWRAGFYERLGRGFAYPADEFFLASGTPLPQKSWYDDFCQEENGVGMAAEFAADFHRGRPDLERTLAHHLATEGHPMRVAACTGRLGAELFGRHLLEDLQAMPGLEFTLLETENTFFGASITISGLLTSGCFSARLEDEDLHGLDAVLLPSNCTNESDVFLDDVSLQDFSARYPCPILRGSYDLAADLAALVRPLSREVRAAG